jgi:hypothetical protein
MKTLNRPMFKNGGPIKEGIMSGMKEPQAINTVGSPLAPQDSSGRQGYAIPLIGAGLAAAARFLPAAYRGFKAARAYTPMSQKLGTMGRLKDIFMPKAGLGAGMAETGAGAGFRTGSLLRSNPLSLGLPAASIGLEAGTKAISGAAKMLPDALKSYANTIIPFADPFKTGPKELKETGGDKKLEIVDNIKTVPNADTGAGSKSDAEKDKINEDRINETKKKYYKLMGIDKMNKNAAYDSLIDASKIIQEEGGDLKGSIKSGNLQNRIIQAISGNLDKSADLKKQIDAAVLKGEISKDIEKSKLDAFDKQLKVLGVDGYRKKSLGLTSVAEDINLQNISGKSIPTSNSVASTIIAKGTGVDGILPDDKYQKWEKANEGKSELNYIQENFSGLDDGLYVVNKKAVQVKDGQIAFVDLDSIIG